MSILDPLSKQSTLKNYFFQKSPKPYFPIPMRGLGMQYLVCNSIGSDLGGTRCFVANGISIGKRKERESYSPFRKKPWLLMIRFTLPDVKKNAPPLPCTITWSRRNCIPRWWAHVTPQEGEAPRDLTRSFIGCKYFSFILINEYFIFSFRRHFIEIYWYFISRNFLKNDVFNIFSRK